MLQNEDVILFLATCNPERALAFYRDVLGLRLIDDEPFALVFEINERMLRIAKLKEFSAAKHTVLGWKVKNIEAAVDKLAARGVEFTFFDGMEQDDRGIWTAPGGARVAWFDDPDGNNLSLTQF